MIYKNYLKIFLNRKGERLLREAIVFFDSILIYYEVMK